MIWTNKQKQKFLRNQSFYTGNIDGKWGPLSQEATKEFQKSQHLQVDGKFGPATTKQAQILQKAGWYAGDIKLTYTRTSGAVQTVYIKENSLLSKNFRLNEYMMHKDTAKKAGVTETERKKVILHEKLIQADQKLRDGLGVSINITSGYRNAKYNAYIGGSKTSMHKEGKASDKTCSKTPKQVQEYIRKHWKKLGYTRMESKTKPNCNQYTHSDIKYTGKNYLVEY